MNYQEYHKLFEEDSLYVQALRIKNQQDLIHFTKLNQARMRRWDQQLELDPVLVQQLETLSNPQHWIIITEPWCGDAAHAVPFFVRMAQSSSQISYEIQLRDSEPYLIDRYLTNGKRGIPKLIARTPIGKDLFTWGPRPETAQRLRDQLTAASTNADEIKLALQQWYNADKGRSLCSELQALLGKR